MTRWAHVFGNWKWTGPADLVLAQVAALEGRSELILGHCPFPDQAHFVAERALQRGLEPVLTRELRKHWNPLRTPRAAAELARRWVRKPPSLVHVHFDGDHAAVAAAAARLDPRPAVVRTLHATPPHPRRRRRLLTRQTHLVLAPTPALARGAEENLGWSLGEVGVLEPDVDSTRFRFDPERRRRGRELLGLPPEAFAVGIVARVQRHRRFEVVLDAWHVLRKTARPPHLVILGRGTHVEELVKRPIAERGLSDHVHLPGYQEGDAYLDALAACDAGLFMVPGSDVTCRAVREWMAMGRGVVATRRSPLPELVLQDADGLLIDETAEDLAAAWTEPDRRERWRRRGEAAARKARTRWAPAHLAENARLYYRMAEAARPGAANNEGRSAAALAVVRPGWLPSARFWAEERGWSAQELAVLNPSTSRDRVLDAISLRAATGARRILLEHSPDWDASFVAELRRQFRVELTLLETRPESDSTAERWLRSQADEVWNPPIGPGS